MPPNPSLTGSNFKKRRPAAGLGAVVKKGSMRKSYHWSAEEHSRFLAALEDFGASSCSDASPVGAGQRGGVERVPVGLGHGVAERIAGHVGTRSVSQVIFSPPLLHVLAVPSACPSFHPSSLSQKQNLSSLQHLLLPSNLRHSFSSILIPSCKSPCRRKVDRAFLIYLRGTQEKRHGILTDPS